MNPEQRIAQLERTVAALAQQLKQLSNNTTIPFDVEKAFRNRLGINYPVWKIEYDYAGAAVSNNKSVNEAGTSSYSVLNVPDGYLFITLPVEDQDITTLGIPFYNQ